MIGIGPAKLTTRLALLLAGAAVLCAAAGCKDEDGTRNTVAAETRSWSSGDLEVEVTLSETEATTADRITVTVRSVAPPGVPGAASIDEAVFTPDPDEPSDQEWTVADARRERATVLEDGRRLERAEFVLEPFLPGEYTIPALTIGAEEGPSVTTEPMSVNVASVLGDEAEAEPAGIKDIVDPPERDLTMVWILLGAVGSVFLAAMAAIGWFVWRNMRRPVIVRAPAHDVALRRLDRLVGEGLHERGQVELFLDRASGILRRYIEDRFGLRAPEMTTDEFLRASRGSVRFSPDDVDLMERFLRQVDRVKFAAASATPDQAHEAIETIRGFVRRTRSAEHLIVVGRDEAEGIESVRRERVNAGGEGVAA